MFLHVVRENVHLKKARLKELELDSNKSENQTKDIDAKIEKHKDQLFLVTNNKINFSIIPA